MTILELILIWVIVLLIGGFTRAVIARTLNNKK